MKRVKQAQSRLYSPVQNTFERMKQVYISQIQKSDPLPQKIIDHLYLGSVGAAYNLEVLKSLNISHILTVCECLPPKFPNEFTYKVISVTDEPSTRLSNHFKEALDFIKTAIDEGKNVLVHCFAGVSRSASIVCAYLIKYQKMEFSTALAFVRAKRPWVNPNYGFQAQLRRYSFAVKEQRKKGIDV